MRRFLTLLALTFLFALACPGQSEQELRTACANRCYSQAFSADDDVDRQEIISLEKEAAHAILINDPTFFRRIYSEEFVGVLSSGQVVNKTKFLEAAQSSYAKYSSFVASDVHVRVDQQTAIATCVWSMRGSYRGREISGQMRLLHVYVNGQRGWHLMASQATHLPPATESPL